METHSQSDAPSRPRPAREVRPVPPEPSAEPDEPPQGPRDRPTVHREGRAVVVEHGGLLPADFCIRCGRPAAREVEAGLRHPANPATWFGRRPAVDVGLCRRHYENHAVAVAVTWSMLGLGGLLLVAGAVGLSWVTCLVGVVAVAVSGVFRAASPVTSRDADDYRATILGAGEAYRRRLPAGGTDEGGGGE